MTGIPLGGLQYFKKVSGFVPAGQVFVVAIGKDGKGCKAGEKPCLYAVVSRESISDMAALDAISQHIKAEADAKYEKECSAYWIDLYDSDETRWKAEHLNDFPPDEALGRAGADE
jgi:hypothetical protein